MEASPVVDCESKLWKALHPTPFGITNFATVPAEADHLGLKAPDSEMQQLVHAFAASVGSNLDPANGVSEYQGEVQLAVNPNNPLQIVAGANSFYRDPAANCQSPTGGSANTFGTQALYGSSDGGATWTYKCAPWPASLTGGVTGASYYFGSDPAMVWDNNGNAYAVYMLISQTLNGDAGAAVVVARSTDSGSTWTSLGTVVNNIANTSLFDDKEMVAVDQSPGAASTLSHPGRIYVVWDENNVERMAHSDNGTSWSTVVLPTPSIGQYDIGGDVKVGPDGTVYVIWNRLVYTGNNQTSEVNVFSKSVDGGVTWSAPVSVATLSLLSFGNNNTPPAQDFRAINSFGSLTLDSNPASAYYGRLYVAFADFPNGTTSGTNTNTYVATSTNGGITWSARVKVNDDSGTATQFFPWAAVDQSDGSLNVAWYDTRADATNRKAQFYYGRSVNGGASFEPNILITDNGGTAWDNAVTYFDENTSDNPSSNANQYGDYAGIIAVNRKVYPLWTDTRQFYPVINFSDNRNEDLATAVVVNCSVPSSVATPTVSIGTSCAAPTVVVTWTAPSGWGTNATSGTYSVYRSTTPGFPGGSPLASGLTSPTYSDTTGSGGTTYYYFVTATNNCPGTALTPMTATSSASASIVFPVTLTPATITVNPSTIPGGVMNVFYTTSFTATGGSGAITFGLVGTLPAGLTLTGNTLSGTPTQAGASFPITITATDASGCTGSRAYTLVIALPAGSTPTLLSATATSTSSVSLSWTPVDQTNHYEITRSSGGGAAGTIASPATNTYTDTASVVASTTYVYRVRAISNSSVASPYSTPDIATTIVFTDDPLVVNTTAVKAAHLTELRTAVNAVRAAGGLGAFTFTDTTVSGIAIKATHIQQLRTALDAARTAIGVPSLTYANTLTPGATPVHAVDITEVRNGVK
jgi:hypothetical protein